MGVDRFTRLECKMRLRKCDNIHFGQKNTCYWACSKLEELENSKNGPCFEIVLSHYFFQGQKWTLILSLICVSSQLDIILTWATKFGHELPLRPSNMSNVCLPASDF